MKKKLWKVLRFETLKKQKNPERLRVVNASSENAAWKMFRFLFLAESFFVEFTCDSHRRRADGQ